jgi:hypothetical protein
MWNRKWLLGAIVASALGAIPMAASAAIYVDIAPPEPRHEILPPAREGFVWAPGHYVWRNGDYRWIPGHWVRAKRNMYWHPGHWVERNGRYVFVEPGWRRERFAYSGYGYARDSDRDGIPNRVDRDRDNDGVPNRYDRAPDNPYRR